ncbi:hypothetical protein O9G_003314 [Rozella allomycis CSF55]|uniref:Uncharacterized protein n=1 Tax=Rozella allomycis (strain CSF55) TaxID=988480 RepID=A0A075B1M6_ROZAC|nr:hypothetical protein O9G_003314 [Rozella allomycis CSF55]|eukprot:EPZ36443.1 hypothetical protein O9G_003314 [Rozella allomycis CSF55]
MKLSLKIATPTSPVSYALLHSHSLIHYPYTRKVTNFSIVNFSTFNPGTDHNGAYSIPVSDGFCESWQIRKNGMCFEKGSRPFVVVQSKFMEDYVGPSSSTDSLFVFKTLLTFYSGSTYSQTYPLSNQTVYLKCMDFNLKNVLVTDLNGNLVSKNVPLSTSLTDDKYLLLKTDSLGRLSVSIPAVQLVNGKQKLAHTLLFFRTDFMNMNENIMITPDLPLLHSMAKVKSGKDLLKSKDGRTLVNSSVTEQDAEFLASILKKLVGSMINSSLKFRKLDGHSVILRPERTKFSGGTLSSKYIFSEVQVPNSLPAVTLRDVVKVERQLPDDIENSLEGMFKSKDKDELWNEYKAIQSSIVIKRKDETNPLVIIAKAAGSIVTETVDNVVHASGVIIKKFLRTIEDAYQLIFSIFARDLAKFFAALFRWDEIVRTAVFLESHFHKTIGYLKSNIARRSEFIDSVEDTINNATEIFQNMGANKIGSFHNSSNAPNGPKGPESIVDIQISRMISFVGNHASYKATDEDVIKASDEMDSLNKFQSDEFYRKRGFAKGLTNAKWSEIFVHIGNIMKHSGRINIPFVTQIYESIVMKGESKLSVLSLVCLLSSIPPSVLYRLNFDEPLFTKNELDLFVATVNPSKYLLVWETAVNKSLPGVRKTTPRMMRNRLSYALGGAFFFNSLVGGINGIVLSAFPFLYFLQTPFHFIKLLSSFPYSWFYSENSKAEVDLFNFKFLAWLWEWMPFLIGFSNVHGFIGFTMFNFVTVVATTLPSICFILGLYIFQDRFLTETQNSADRTDIVLKTIANLMLQIPSILSLFQSAWAFPWINVLISSLPLLSSGIHFTRLELAMKLNATFFVLRDELKEKLDLSDEEIVIQDRRRHIIIKGIRVNEVKDYLYNKGF